MTDTTNTSVATDAVGTAQNATTTTASIEPGNVIQQVIDPVTGDVTQVVHTAETTVTADATAVTDKVEADVKAGVATVDDVAPSAEVGLAQAKLHANALFTMLHNVGSHIDLDLQAVDKTVQSLLGSLGHVFKGKL